MDFKNINYDVSILINTINDEFRDYIDDKYDVYL